MPRDLYAKLPIKRKPPSPVMLALRKTTVARDKAERIVSICRLFGLPPPDREYRFTPARMWRFDCAWVDAKLAVEVHGGAFSGGRHATGSGLVADSEKLRAAVLLGWRVLVFTTTDLAERNASAVADVLRLALHGSAPALLASVVKRKWTTSKAKRKP